MAATPGYRAMLATYLKPQRGRFWGLAVALLGGIGLQLLNPQILRYFIDTAIAGGQQRSLLLAAGAFVAIAVLQQGLAIATTYFSETIAWRATNTLRLDLARHALGLDLALQSPHPRRTGGAGRWRCGCPVAVFLAVCVAGGGQWPAGGRRSDYSLV